MWNNTWAHDPLYYLLMNRALAMILNRKIILWTSFWHCCWGLTFNLILVILALLWTLFIYLFSFSYFSRLSACLLVYAMLLPPFISLLGLQILTKWIEVDKVKIQIIEKLPPSMSVKGVCNFLGRWCSIWITIQHATPYHQPCRQHY